MAHHLRKRIRSIETAQIVQSRRDRRIPHRNGPADYALSVGGEIVGIVEAKKLTLGPQNVLSQAERYGSQQTRIVDSGVTAVARLKKYLHYSDKPELYLLGRVLLNVRKLL